MPVHHHSAGHASFLQVSPATKSKPQHSKLPWTAGRCLRLLRQLESRLASLGKPSLGEPEASRLSTRRPKRSLPPDTYDAPQAPKKIRFTYTSRKRSALDSVTYKTPPRHMRSFGSMARSSKCSPSSALVEIATPVWSRIREQPDTPLDTKTQRDDYNYSHQVSNALPSGLLNDLRSMQSRMTAENYRTCEAIFGWLSWLLRCTKPEPQHASRKSLLGMCLYKIPECIANIQAYEEQRAREEGCQNAWVASDVSYEIYGQLEALGFQERGWQPLKLALRSHAIFLLCKATMEGTFEAAYVGLLTRLCLCFHCKQEASSLATSATIPLPAPRSALSIMGEDERLRAVQYMIEALKDRAVAGTVIRCLSSLAGDHVLPNAWLSAKAFAGAWAWSLEAIAVSRSAVPGFMFMATCIPILATCDDSSAQQMLVGLAAGIVAVAAATTKTTTPHAGNIREPKRIRAWRRALYVLDLCLAKTRQLRRKAGCGLFSLALARYLVATGSPFADDSMKRHFKLELEDMAQRAEDPKAYHRQTVVLLCSLVLYRSRSCAVPGRDSVAKLCAELDNVDFGDCSGVSLRFDVAFMVAQKTKDLRDLAFAESLSGSDGHMQVTTVYSGWLWEEGISEWVLPSISPGQGRDTEIRAKRPRRRSQVTKTLNMANVGSERSMASLPVHVYYHEGA